MKPALKTCFSVVVALSLTGCPVYPSDDLCRSDWDCASGYACNGDGACVWAGAVACAQPSDCNLDQNEVCSAAGICKAGSCHVADTGCVAGYTCIGTDPQKAWTCVRSDLVSGAGGTSSIPDAGSATGGATLADAG
jgi:hypothetical protein